MNNPWSQIKLSDYENHMSLESIYQLQTLNTMMKGQLSSYDTESVMILGIAGGNGLEHIDPQLHKKVYGVDVNKEYLDECSKRYPQLEKVLTLICAELSDENTLLPHAELLIADLLIEYIGYDSFGRILKNVRPDTVSCIIQINTDESFVSASPYIHVFDCLESVHHNIDENSLTECMIKNNYKKIFSAENILTDGKKLLRLDFAADIKKEAAD
ncbi:MAG: methyltransferase type 11 [Oscillospiraceae bacterium]|nr:methyltransferase type 11 [Oscillospiraceae bacterium]